MKQQNLKKESKYQPPTRQQLYQIAHISKIRKNSRVIETEFPAKTIGLVVFFLQTLLQQDNSSYEEEEAEVGKHYLKVFAYVVFYTFLSYFLSKIKASGWFIQPDNMLSGRDISKNPETEEEAKQIILLLEEATSNANLIKSLVFSLGYYTIIFSQLSSSNPLLAYHFQGSAIRDLTKVIFAGIIEGIKPKTITKVTTEISNKQLKIFNQILENMQPSLSWTVSIDKSEKILFELKSDHKKLKFNEKDIQFVIKSKKFFELLQKAFLTIKPKVIAVVDSQGFITDDFSLTESEVKTIELEFYERLKQTKIFNEQKKFQTQLICMLQKATFPILLWFSGSIIQTVDKKMQFSIISNSLNGYLPEKINSLKEILENIFGEKCIQFTNRFTIQVNLLSDTKINLTDLKTFCSSIKLPSMTKLASQALSIPAADPQETDKEYSKFHNQKDRYTPTLFKRQSGTSASKQEIKKTEPDITSAKQINFSREDFENKKFNLSTIFNDYPECESITVPFVIKDIIIARIMIRRKELVKFSDQGNYLLNVLNLDIAEGGHSGRIKTVKTCNNLWRELKGRYKIRVFGKTSGDERAVLVPEDNKTFSILPNLKPHK